MTITEHKQQQKNELKKRNHLFWTLKHLQHQQQKKSTNNSY